MGFASAAVSYAKLGLKQSDFRPIVNGVLRSVIMHFAENCDVAAVYGTTYSEGTGMHDIHKHNDPAKQQDGAIAFYFREVGELPVRRWVFIKFARQKLA